MGQGLGQRDSLKIRPNHFARKTKEKFRNHCDFGTFFGCGGRTRTYDLRVMRGFRVSLAFLNPLKCGELVQVFRSFSGSSEQLSYSPTIVDTHFCTFFDSVLEEMLESNFWCPPQKDMENAIIIYQNMAEMRESDGIIKNKHEVHERRTQGCLHVC